MKVRVISADDLDVGLQKKWAALQATSSTLNRPFYHHGFTRLVADCRAGVRIAVVEADGEVCAFLPHEVGAHGELLQVGLRLNDYHGLIAKLDTSLDLHALLSTLRLRYWHFDHAPLQQSALAPFIRMRSSSPYMNVSGGLELYHQRLAAAQGVKNPGILTSMRKSAKRLERDFGPLRFIWKERSSAVLEQLMAWKTQQWMRTVGASHNAFDEPWIRNMLFKSCALSNTDFCGNVSSLFAGNRLVAAHFGYRSDKVLHGCFASFDPELGYYTPGSLLLLQLAEQAYTEGVNIFDMGRGASHYKMRFATDQVEMGEGAVSRPQLFAEARMWQKSSLVRLKSKLKAMIKPRPSIQ